MPGSSTQKLYRAFLIAPRRRPMRSHSPQEIVPALGRHVSGYRLVRQVFISRPDRVEGEGHPRVKPAGSTPDCPGSAARCHEVARDLSLVPRRRDLFGVRVIDHAVLRIRGQGVPGNDGARSPSPRCNYRSENGSEGCSRRRAKVVAIDNLASVGYCNALNRVRQGRSC